MNDTLASVSPRAAALIGATPERGYWLMFLCSALRYLNASSSPKTCTSVAMAV
jgi:hypothetical protein